MGYDLASSFIHPRADEGHWDALRLVGKNPVPEFRKLNILKNSILIANSILMNSCNFSEHNFGKYLNLYCNVIFGFLNEGEELPNLQDIEKIFFASQMKNLEA